MDFILRWCLMFICYLLVIVGVLVGVAFLVLLERSVLGYIQIRKGPNKVGFTGILQSFGDAIKLFIKEPLSGLTFNLVIYYFSPIFSLFLVLVLWMVMPYVSVTAGFMLGSLFFFCCTSFGVYTLMGSGWSSNSNYATLGAIRGVAQTVSYEVSMALIFLCVVIICGKYSLLGVIDSQSDYWFIFFYFPIFLCWVTSCVAETNRTPFDFAEGESELVSGFNIEYGGGGFALLFLAEYGSIIFMSFLISVVFMGGVMNLSQALFLLMGSFFCFWFIWIRGTLPRFRYDKLMYLAWKSFLPVSLCFLFFYYGYIILLT